MVKPGYMYYANTLGGQVELNSRNANQNTIATLFYILIPYLVIVMSPSEPEFQAWNVSECQFPKEGTKTEQLKFLLNYAILAPSSHNTQPWLFRIVDDNIIE